MSGLEDDERSIGNLALPAARPPSLGVDAQDSLEERLVPAKQGATRATLEAPAAEVLADSQLAVLKGIGKRPLQAEPTVREALFAITRLGGHLRSNGPPGWLTIARGMVALAQAHLGWVAEPPWMPGETCDGC